ncbi:MAG TPA: hypothetical protein VFQ35_08920 [Polyangiaceae bacterium]|nr:hypothetical protein [Polyangiaceae bacterium]
MIRATVILLGCANSQDIGSRAAPPENKQPANTPDNTPPYPFNVTPPNGGNAGAGGKGSSASKGGHGGANATGGSMAASATSGGSGSSLGGAAAGGRTMSGSGGTGLAFGSGSAGSSSNPNGCPTPTRALTNSGGCVDRFALFSVGGAPSSIAAVADQTVWFEDERQNELVQLDLSGKIINTLRHSTPASERALIAGSGDTILWFSDPSDRSVSKVSRTLDVFPFGLGIEPAGIALDASDTLWLTEAAQAVYRLQLSSNPDAQRFIATPSGSIAIADDGTTWYATPTGLAGVADDGTPFDLPLAQVSVSDLCNGPDGAIWFTEVELGRIGRLDGASLTFYPLPDGGEPHRIIAGPDEAIWFTEQARGSLVRLDLGGEFRDFPIPGGGAEPAGITVGADGNIWFTQRVAGKVGRLTPDAIFGP